MGRDASGTLWYYDSQFVYNELAGAGDANRDGFMDLLARDTTGMLWLYKGTGNTTTPFTTRTKIGGGWNTYNRLF
ncbi:hypothetical protein ACF09C_31100 [Streptomyces sp. NPDC014870]|uniref:hypothetical protein n=1 Tax=Streptomyces sp. NPDC014870 TaxID=3364925 RepID=UPI0036F75F02